MRRIFKLRNLFLLVSFLLWFFLPSSSLLSQDSPPNLYEKSNNSFDNWRAKQPSDLTYSPVQFNHSVLQRLETREIQQVSIPGPDNSSITAHINQIIPSVNGGWSAVGFLNNRQLNSFVLSYSPSTGKVLSSMNMNSEHTFFEIRYDSYQSQHILVEKDPHRTDELPCIHDDQVLIPENLPQNKRLRSLKTSHDHETSVIDVMIVYTPNAENWANANSSGIANIVNSAMATANLIAVNSELDIEFRLVHSRRIEYTESGNSALDLERLTAAPGFNPFGSESAGYMDEVHSLRDQYGADLVALFTETDDTGGLAWIINRISGVEQYAFSITRVQQASGRTHAHEMGHNFGNLHSRNQNVNPAEDGTGLFDYSTGWRWTGNDGFEYASVMTYLEGASQALLFSNPDVLYEGVPSGSYEGEFAPADNARSMRQVQHVVEDYRAETVNFNPPTVATVPVTDISYSRASVGGNVSNNGGSEITSRGICWDMEPNPGQPDDCIQIGTGLGIFHSQLTNLDQGTQYYVRAYATNISGTSYGSQQMFTTLTLPEPSALPPQNIDAVSFVANWSNVEQAERYFLDLSTNPNFSSFVPDFQNRDVGDNTSLKISGLQPGTDYYYRVRSGAETVQSDNSNVREASTTDISVQNSEVTVSRNRVLATGVQESVIMVIVEDTNGQPVPGIEVVVEAGGDFSNVSPNQAETNNSGMATFTITSNSEGAIQYNVFAAGLSLSEDIEIEFLFSEGELTLDNNFPNPFNSQTMIPIVVPQPMRVRLDIFDSVGSIVQTILDEEFNVGYYEIPFNASGLASGVYFYRMVTDQGVRVEKMLLAK